MRLNISPEVRAALGPDTADALLRGVGIPADAQCWKCGEAANLFAAPDTAVFTITAVVITDLVTTAVFAHRGCTISRVLTVDQWQRMASKKPSPVHRDEEIYVDPDGTILLDSLIINGEPVRVVPLNPPD